MKPFIKRNKRKLFNAVYRLRFGSFEAEMLKRQLPLAETNALLFDSIGGAAPFFAGRMGTVECGICWNLARARFHDYRHSVKSKLHATRNAGISLEGDEHLNRFAAVYTGGLPYLDLAAWWEPAMLPMLHKFGKPDLRVTELYGFEPWNALQTGGTAWTRALEGQRVLVVHPFAESIRKQYAIRHEISAVRDVMPSFELDTLVPPITFAGERNGRTWLQNLQMLMAETAKRRFDVALIGCGAYGLPLGAFIKQLGRKSVHLGGAVQLLFGIRGARWDAWNRHAQLMTAGWVRPAEHERPVTADAVEGACYW